MTAEQLPEQPDIAFAAIDATDPDVTGADMLGDNLAELGMIRLVLKKLREMSPAGRRYVRDQIEALPEA